MAAGVRKAILNVVAVINDAPEKVDDALQRAGTGSGALGVQKVANILTELAGGVRAGRVYVSVDKVVPGAAGYGSELAQAVVTIINHASMVSLDTLYVHDVPFVFVQSPSTSLHVDISTSAAGDAANLAAAINASILTKNLVSATAASNRVTITSKIPGQLGRVRLATTDNTAMGIGGAATVQETGSLVDTASNTYTGVSSDVRVYRCGV